MIRQGHTLFKLACINMLWLFAFAAHAAGTKCDLTFEAIPSKNAGMIIGSEIQNQLAGKNYKQWLTFTKSAKGPIEDFLDQTYGDIADFNLITYGMGGFEGKSSPNMIFAMDFKQTLTGDPLGKIASEITAAIGYILIQDGTVGECENSVGDAQNSIPGYLISGKRGFENLNANIVKTIYSAMVSANDNPGLGYTYEENNTPLMEMLDFDNTLVAQIATTNIFLSSIFTSTVSIQATPLRGVNSVYEANNWAKDPQGIPLLKKIAPTNFLLLLMARKAYVDALKNFADS